MKHARLLALCALLALPLAGQDVIAPNENLVAEGIPKIPATLADAVGRYSEFRRASFASWHPEKREMLIVTRFGDTWQVHRVAQPGGDRRQLTFYKDNVRNGVAYPPRKRDGFAFLRDHGGDENFQLFRFDPSTGEATLLTDGASRNTGNVWSNAGDRIAYGSNKRSKDDVDLWVVDPSDPKSARMLCELKGGGWGPADWSPDDSKLLLAEFLSANESYIWLVDARTGEKSLLTPKGGAEKISYQGAGFSKDGKGIYLTSDEGSEFQRLIYMDLASKKKTVLTAHINWDVESFTLSNDGARLAFSTNEDGVNVLRLLDTKTGKELPKPVIPIGTLGGLEFHHNGRDLGFTLSSNRAASDAYSLDVTTGKLERWTFSETGGLNTETFAEPELIRWKSFDGRSISGFLYRPPAKFTGKRPVVVDIHGGPEGQFQPGFIGSSNYTVNELGIARIYPNVRGSTGYGKTFLQLDNGFKREDSYKDVLALFDWIKTQPGLDADRVMVTGGSYGGFMTLAVATNYSDRIRCALDVVGPSNFVTFLENTSGYRRDLRRVEYGDERDPKMREFLNRIAPNNKAAEIKKPLFVVQGKNDPRVPLTESEQMVATVRKQGTPVWYLMAKDEGHGFQKKGNGDFLIYSSVAFMKEFLLK